MERKREKSRDLRLKQRDYVVVVEEACAMLWSAWVLAFASASGTGRYMR